MNPALAQSLEKVIAAAPQGRDDWWLIGSAAAHLSGVDLAPADVDIVAGRETIEAFLARLGPAQPKPSENGRFRSIPFCCIPVSGGLDIEVMGDLHVLSSGVWQPLILTTRVPVETGHGPVFVPTLAEQVAVFELFGRPKDLAKAAMAKAAMVRGR